MALDGRGTNRWHSSDGIERRGVPRDDHKLTREQSPSWIANQPREEFEFK